MTTFQINSIVQQDGSIVIPTPSLTPGTSVHVVVTATEETPLVSRQAEAVDLAIQEADRRYGDTFRRLAE